MKTVFGNRFSVLREPRGVAVPYYAIALALIAGFVAFVANYREAAAIAVGVAITLGVAALFLVGRSSYRVDVDLSSERVVVGETAAGRLLVTNGAGRSQRPSLMELPVGAGSASWRVPRLAPGATYDEPFVVPTQRRAVIPVGPARSVRGDPLGLWRREVRWTEPDLLYVHPRTIRLDSPTPGLLRDLEGEVTTDVTNSDVSFHALRDYVPGDDRRYIHWRSSARTGVLLVRQFEQTRRSHIAVVLSTTSADYIDGEQFELAVEAAASIGLQAFRDKRQVSLLTSAGVAPVPNDRRFLDRLSAVELAEMPLSVVDLARRTVRDAPKTSIAFLVCGSLATPTQIKSAAAAFPVDVQLIVVRAVAGAAVRIRMIAGTPIVAIGELADLPLGLRKVRGR